MSTSKSFATTPQRLRHRLGRAVLLVLGMSSLVMGIWGGLLRVPVALPLPVSHANWISFHGPLMVCGFLGTVISLERAVGLRALWTYLVPLLTGVGAAAIAAGVPAPWPRWTLTVGSALFVVVSARILFIQPNLANCVMGLGAVAWLAGNGLWTRGHEIPQVVLWWLTFLLLTIVGERIELTRFQKPSRSSRPWLLTTLVILGAGLAIGWFAPRWPQASGVVYDATLHAFFLGFVFAMIFGHAPVIFPAVLGLPVQFRWTSYVPLAVLHVSLLLRLLGDLAGLPILRTLGAVGNAVAVGLFLLNMVFGFILPAKPNSTR